MIQVKKFKGIVEKAQETSSDTGMHDTVLLPLLYFMNSGCILECSETPTSQVTIGSLYPSLFVDAI